MSCSESWNLQNHLLVESSVQEISKCLILWNKIMKVQDWGDKNLGEASLNSESTLRVN